MTTPPHRRPRATTDPTTDTTAHESSTAAESAATPRLHAGDTPEIVLVALVACNGVIGDGEDQPWRFREDFRRFKDLTMGHPLLMGRRTFDAIGRALPGRETVVLTRDRAWSHEGVRVAHDLDAALETAAALPGGGQIMVLGGGEVYRAVMDRATRLELTEVDAPAVGETRFPDVDPLLWTETSRDDRAVFAFVTYERIPDATG